MTIEDRIRDLRGSISVAQAKKARAAVELDSAKARLADARKTLKDDYGVTTNEEAKAVQAQLKAELDSTIEEIEAALSEAGA